MEWRQAKASLLPRRAAVRQVYPTVGHGSEIGRETVATEIIPRREPRIGVWGNRHDRHSCCEPRITEPPGGKQASQASRKVHTGAVDRTIDSPVPYLGSPVSAS